VDEKTPPSGIPFFSLLLLLLALFICTVLTEMLNPFEVVAFDVIPCQVQEILFSDRVIDVLHINPNCLHMFLALKVNLLRIIF